MFNEEKDPVHARITKDGYSKFIDKQSFKKDYIRGK